MSYGKIAFSSCVLLILSGFVLADIGISPPSLTPDPIYQGDSGSITVTLSNNYNYQICTKQFYIQFDFQKTLNQVFSASGTPCVATGNSYTFTVPISIPSSATVGTHNFEIGWVDQGYLLGTVKWMPTIQIHDAYEKVYLNTLGTVQAQINQANAANYQSPDARSDLSQASNYVNQAQTLSSQGQFQAAVNALNQVNALINQANAAEQTYQAQLAAQRAAESGQQNSQGIAPPQYPGASNPNGSDNSQNGNQVGGIVALALIGGGVVFIFFKQNSTTEKENHHSKEDEEKVCETCGTENKLHAKHCHECGKKLG